MKHSRSMSQKLTMEEIGENVVIIKINESFREGMSKTELYDVTRGCWKRKIASVEKADYALVLSVKLDAPAPCRLVASDLDFACRASADCLPQHLQVI